MEQIGAEQGSAPLVLGLPALPVLLVLPLLLVLPVLLVPPAVLVLLAELVLPPGGFEGPHVGPRQTPL